MRGNTEVTTPAPSRRGSRVNSPYLRPTNAGLVPLSDQGVDDMTLQGGDEPHAATFADPNDIAPLSDAPLSFGYGGLLRDGAGEGDPDEFAAQFGSHDTIVLEEELDNGRTLKGKYIVRVGWDDVRGWLGEGGTLIGSSRCPSCEFH